MSSFMNSNMTADTMSDQLIASQILRGLGQPMIVDSAMIEGACA